MTTIIDRTGSIFDSGAEVLVNPINCMGVAGKGLALEFKKRFPENQEACEIIYRKEVSTASCLIALPWFYWFNGVPDRPRAVLNFPTKRHWRDLSRIDDIDGGLRELRRILRGPPKAAIRSIAFPALGCGLGGLKWEDVRPLIVESMNGIDELEVHLYGPR